MNEETRHEISQWIGSQYIDGTTRRLLQTAMEEIERYQALCSAAYQLAGLMNAPVRFLDALSDGANGGLEARAKTADLLPVLPTEVGTFLSDEGEDFRDDAERYRWIRDLKHTGFNLDGPENIGNFHVSQKVRSGEAHYYGGRWLDAAIDDQMEKDKP